MKYTTTHIGKDGKKVHKFRAPKDALKAGVVSSKTFTDGRTARYEIPKLIARIEAFRKGKVFSEVLDKDSKFKHVAANFLHSDKFLATSRMSQRNFQRSLSPVCSSSFGDLPVSKITYEVLKDAYAKWKKGVSVSTANVRLEKVRVILNYAKDLGLIEYNPVKLIDKAFSTPEYPIWTKDQVERFLEVAFSKFEWRNIGLLVMMSYEWNLYPHQLSSLKWSDLDLEAGIVNFKGERVIEEPLLSMLKDHKGDWDFQGLVVPHYRKGDGKYVRLQGNHLSGTMAAVKAEAGLPKELNIFGLKEVSRDDS